MFVEDNYFEETYEMRNNLEEFSFFFYQFQRCVNKITHCFSMLCSQDNYFEEAYKMRNVLEELIKHRRKERKRKPSILGLREHIFTGR